MNAPQPLKDEKLNLQLILPFVIPAFIDKLGGAGISAVSPYLVTIQMPEAQSSLILGIGRGAAVLAPLALGVLSERVKFKYMVVVSLFISATFFVLLPISTYWPVIMMCVFMTQLSIASVKFSIRGLLFENLPTHLQMEGIGWLRLATNTGSICGYGVASLFATSFIAGIFYWDAASSVVAGIFMILLLRRKNSAMKETISSTQNMAGNPENTPESAVNSAIAEPEIKKNNYADPKIEKIQHKNAVFHVILFSLFSLLWCLGYDLFDTGASARYERLAPGKGSSFFYSLMLINTIMCAVLSVKAGKYLKKPSKIILAGTVLTTLGAILGLNNGSNFLKILGMTLWTLSEIGTLAVLLFLINLFAKRTQRPGFWAGFGFAAINMSKPLAGILVFPFIVNSDRPYLILLTLAIPTFIAALCVNQIAKKHEIYL